MKSKDFTSDVLRKLFARRVIGKHHMRLETLLRCGWKSHEKGLVKEAINKLLNDGLIVWEKKSKKALTLNKERIDQIIHLCTKG